MRSPDATTRLHDVVNPLGSATHDAGLADQFRAKKVNHPREVASAPTPITRLRGPGVMLSEQWLRLVTIVVANPLPPYRPDGVWNSAHYSLLESFIASRTPMAVGKVVPSGCSNADHRERVFNDMALSGRFTLVPRKESKSLNVR